MKSSGNCGLPVLSYRSCDSHKINITWVLFSKVDMHRTRWTANSVTIFTQEYTAGDLISINASVGNTWKSRGIWWGLESDNPVKMVWLWSLWNKPCMYWRMKADADDSGHIKCQKWIQLNLCYAVSQMVLSLRRVWCRNFAWLCIGIGLQRIKLSVMCAAASVFVFSILYITWYSCILAV